MLMKMFMVKVLMMMMNMVKVLVIMIIFPTRRQEAATPTNTAMRMFQNKDRTGNELLDSSLPTTHQNQVNLLKPPHLLMTLLLRLWSCGSCPEARRRQHLCPPGQFHYHFLSQLFLNPFLWWAIFISLKFLRIIIINADGKSINS